MSRKTTAAIIAVLGIAWIQIGCHTTDQSAARASRLASGPAEYTEQFTVPLVGTQIDFAMVRVPGNPEAGIESFYIATHEVTWRDMYDWMYITDIEDPQRIARLIEAGLRPSPLYELQQGYQVDERDNPAMGMTRWIGLAN